MQLPELASSKKSGQRQQAGVKENYQFARVPPNAVDLEKAVLGSLLLERDALAIVTDILRVGMFYYDAHNTIFENISAVHSRGIQPDVLVVVEELKNNDQLVSIGGAHEISKLTIGVCSGANLVEHCRIIYQTFCSREIIKISAVLSDNCYQNHSEVFDLMDMASESFYFLQEQVFNKGTKNFGDILLRRMNEYDKEPVVDGVTGIPTGFRQVDTKTHGWQPGDLIILAARPSVGKSALAGEFVFRTAYTYKQPVLFFSLEMSAESLVDRMVSSRTKVYMSKLKTRHLSNMDHHQIKRMVQDTHETPIYINDQAGLTLQNICAESRKMKRKYLIKMIVIDYLQLVRLEKSIQRKSGNRDQDIGILTNGLKQLAKELEVPIIVLSQLSREAEKNDRPKLSHLRESGNIEQDADVVMFLHRPFYFQERDGTNMLVDEAEKRRTELIFAKHRNGALGTVDLIWHAENTAFLEADDYLEAEYF